MTFRRETIRQIVFAAIDELNDRLPEAETIQHDDEAILFGPSGSIDSMGLVHLVVNVEQGVADQFGIYITLASEKAMSRENSPFRTAGSLINFVEELLAQEAA